MFLCEIGGKWLSSNDLRIELLGPWLIMLRVRVPLHGCGTACALGAVAILRIEEIGSSETVTGRYAHYFLSLRNT